MSTYFTIPEVILIIQIAAILGFLFLAIYTFYTYLKLKHGTLIFISLAFLVIAVSIILKITIIPILEESLVETALLEAIFESIQFLAAFFFFYGLRIIKSRKEVND